MRKALESRADAVVIDLEDAVPIEEKARARQIAAAAIEERGIGAPGARISMPQLWVRINDARSTWYAADVDALAATALSGAVDGGIRVPKAEIPESIADLAESTGLQIHLLLESARGLMNAQVLAQAHSRVTGVALGEADLSADLRVESAGLAWARGWLVASARASGLPAPTQSVYTDVRDLEGLRRDTHVGRELGFFGRSVIHPSQIPVVHEVFTPTAEQVSRARATVDAAERAAQDGSAAILDTDGRFIDRAVVEQAHVVLSRVRTHATN